MSNLMICRFTSNNFNYNLLVAPSFANGNLFVFPIKAVNALKKVLRAVAERLISILKTVSYDLSLGMSLGLNTLNRELPP